jgi:hypothetical protein
MTNGSKRRRRRLPKAASPVQAAVALIVAIAFIVFIATLGGGGGKSAPPSPTSLPSVEPTSSVEALPVSPADLRALSASLRHPIYWVGPRPSTTYELTRKGTELFLRYLPAGVPVGSSQLELTVGTYEVPNAFTVTTTAAAQPDAKELSVGVDAVAFYRPSRPQSVYLAYRGQDLQIEVYDPSAAEALRLATSGQLRPI